MEKVPATPPDVAQPLRAACIHGRYEEHTFLANPDCLESSIAYRDCSGGPVVTIVGSIIVAPDLSTLSFAVEEPGEYALIWIGDTDE